MAPRVAYFPDSFHEINGVAHTSRNFVAYAQRHNLPFLCVRAGSRDYASLESDAAETLKSRGWAPDYIAVRRCADLGEPTPANPLVVVAAARLGNTRLIDNIEI